MEQSKTNNEILIVDEEIRSLLNESSIIIQENAVPKNRMDDIKDMRSRLAAFLVSSTTPVENVENDLVDDSVISLTTSNSSNSSSSSNIVIDLCTPETNIFSTNFGRRRPFEPNEVIEIDDTFTETPPPKKLTRTSKSSLNQSSDNSQKLELKCPICLDKCHKPTTTKCGHVFCCSCIKKSLKSFNMCPVCRKYCNQKNLVTLFIS